jgi:hypothetical protein
MTDGSSTRVTVCDIGNNPVSAQNTAEFHIKPLAECHVPVHGYLTPIDAVETTAPGSATAIPPGAPRLPRASAGERGMRSRPDLVSGTTSTLPSAASTELLPRYPSPRCCPGVFHGNGHIVNEPRDLQPPNGVPTEFLGSLTAPAAHPLTQ